MYLYYKHFLPAPNPNTTESPQNRINRPNGYSTKPALGTNQRTQFAPLIPRLPAVGGAQIGARLVGLFHANRLRAAGVDLGARENPSYRTTTEHAKFGAFY